MTSEKRHATIIAALLNPETGVLENRRVAKKIVWRVMPDATNDEIEEAIRAEALTLIGCADPRRSAELFAELVDDGFADRLEVILALSRSEQVKASLGFP